MRFVLNSLVVVFKTLLYFQGKKLEKFKLLLLQNGHFSQLNGYLTGDGHFSK